MRQRALESELTRLNQATVLALAKLEEAQRAAVESMRSSGEALQAVITSGDDADAAVAADREASSAGGADVAMRCVAIRASAAYAPCAGANGGAGVCAAATARGDQVHTVHKHTSGRSGTRQ